MKLHLHLAQSVIQAIPEIFDSQKGRYADRVIEFHLKGHKKWGSRDRKFFAETVYDIVRWWRLLWSSLGREPSMNPKELWLVLGASLVRRQIILPEWVEFRELNQKKLEEFFKGNSEARAVQQSIPDWLDQLGSLQLGARWDSLLRALNQPAQVILRTNRLKTTRDHLYSILASEGIETQKSQAFEDALILSERQNVFRTDAFQKGLFEVQDLASQAVAPFLNPQPGDRVVDACAGAGGKTLHLAALMKNKGRIIAMDVGERKLEELRKRCSRAGVDVVESRLIESSKTIKRMESSCDRLLLDVPCTGLGVLRRNPDAKWKLAPNEVENIQALQRDILGSYSKLVKAGGVMVYSTCSLLPSENEKQVEWFLKEHSGWVLEDQKHLWPDEGFDGFYMARLKRN